MNLLCRTTLDRDTNFPSNREIVTPLEQTTLIHHLTTLAARDPGQRGFSGAAASAAHLEAAAQALLDGERIIIATGFCIRAAMIGENDGPPGALALADALGQLGKEVVFVSDRFSVDLLKAGVPSDEKAPSIVVLDPEQTIADQQIADLLQRFQPTRIIAIERPGSALDGHRYSMRGEILDDLAPAADALLRTDATPAIKTIAIGDGGNELGLGGLRAEHMHRVTHGEKIFCATAADLVIAAGISNWGAHALVAALSVLSGRLLMRPPSHERQVLERLQAVGAVDGCTRRPDLSVDGIAWDAYCQTLTEIYRIAADATLCR